MFQYVSYFITNISNIHKIKVGRVSVVLRAFKFEHQHKFFLLISVRNKTIKANSRNDIEERLRSYRKKEDREKFKLTVYSYWCKISNCFNISGFCSKHFKIFENINVSDAENAKESPPPLSDAELDAVSVCNWKRFLLGFMVWCTLFCLAVYIEFGVIYIIISCFYVIWVNTSTRPKYRNEVSAYSVFNSNCEPIDGTLDAEKLQSQMLLGALY